MKICDGVGANAVQLGGGDRALGRRSWGSAGRLVGRADASVRRSRLLTTISDRAIGDCITSTCRRHVESHGLGGAARTWRPQECSAPPLCGASPGSAAQQPIPPPGNDSARQPAAADPLISPLLTANGRTPAAASSFAFSAPGKHHPALVPRCRLQKARPPDLPRVPDAISIALWGDTRLWAPANARANTIITWRTECD